MFFRFSIVLFEDIGLWLCMSLLALDISINTFHYFLRRMILVATPLKGWLLQQNKFQEHGITDTASTSQYVGYRPYC